MEQFDVIVVGGGSAGENIAGRCMDCGSSIAVVESELVGGQCSYWACIPSKTLLRPGEALAQAREAPGAAQVVGDRVVEAKPAFEWRDFQTSGWDDSGQVKWAEGEGMDVLRGEGRIAGPGKVAVGDKTHSADHI